ncbi:hypothetical protein ACFQ61_16355 [Streptomyces sp. NPDC056500]|uniref:hypothetical protein n=1 Tax=Streptomyces sp. NPDC056500 TaxID=3345840 RepID=UPI0036CE5992
MSHPGLNKPEESEEMKSRFSVIGAMVAVVTLLLSAHPAVAAGRPLEGNGWKLLSNDRVTSIEPGTVFTVTFTSTALKTKYTPYLTRSIAQLQAEGVNISIGGVTNVDPAVCPPTKGTIQFAEVYRPLNGQPGMSRALPCWTGDNAAWGGHVQMNSEYWTGWYLPTYMLNNVFPHEMLHVIGLDHPNKDLNGDGTVAAGECVATSSGNKPIMCSPNGGYSTTADQGKLVGFDTAGVRQLIANGTIPSISAKRGNGPARGEMGSPIG